MIAGCCFLSDGVRSSGDSNVETLLGLWRRTDPWSWGWPGCRAWSWCGSWCWGDRRTWRWRSRWRRSWCWSCTRANPRHAHCIRRTTSIGRDFADHKHEGLAVFYVKGKRRGVTRNWALSFVCEPVCADVIWIECLQIRSCKNEIAVLTTSIDINCHALSRPGCICK
jgi:hypothetical protein